MKIGISNIKKPCRYHVLEVAMTTISKLSENEPSILADFL
jgi:hypothetical protein